MIEYPVFAVDGIAKRFGSGSAGLVVLDGVDFSVSDGSWTSCIGPSGCGKTTLLRVLAGLIEPSGGTVTVADPSRRRSDVVAYLPQHDTLLPWRNALDNVLLPAELDGRPRASAETEARGLFNRFGLGGFEDYYPNRLSGGMRQRVALIRAFLAHRDILLLDEPLGALDPLTRMQLQDWLLEVWGELRKTVVLVTHDVAEAVFFSDRIVILTERPARVRRKIDIRLPRPRERDGARVLALSREILSSLLDGVGHA